MEVWKDKQSGEILLGSEMLDRVELDDQLDSFYLIGDFKSKEETVNYLKLEDEKE